MCWHAVLPAGGIWDGRDEIPAGGWECSSSSHIHQYSKLCKARTSEGRGNAFAVFQDHQFSPSMIQQVYFGKERSIMAVVLM